MPAQYKVLLRNKTAQKGWQEICQRDAQGAAQAWQFLTATPETRLPGKVKRLKGKWAGLLQYDVNYSDRLQYWVDQETHTVWVEYAGPHP